MKPNLKMLSVFLKDLTITPEEFEFLFNNLDFNAVIHQLSIVYNNNNNLYHEFVRQLNSFDNAQNEYQYLTLLEFNKNNIYNMIMLMLGGKRFKVDFTINIIPTKSIMIPEYNYTLKEHDKFNDLIKDLRILLGAKTQVEESVKQKYIDQLIEDELLMDALLKVYETKPLTFHLSLVYFHMYDIMLKDFDNLRTMIPYMLDGKRCEIVYRDKSIDEDNIVTLNNPIIIMKDYLK